jgi:hypothetical protein
MMSMRWQRAAIAAGLASFLALSAGREVEAQCLVNISTGFDVEAGDVLPEGVDDDEYLVDAGFGPVNVFTGGPSTGFPVPPWVANDGNSLWISSTVNATDNPGTYTYEITVEIPGGVDASLVAIRGRWATDDPGQDIIVNGVSTGITAGGFTSYTELPGDAGFGLFQEGENLIQFVVVNGGEAPNPTGLRVEACLETVGIDERDYDISTGFSHEEGRLLVDDEQSSDYTIADPNGNETNATAVSEAAGFPIPPWAANGIQSRWIGTSEPSSNGIAGEYVFKTRIFLPAVKLAVARAIIQGELGVDDQVIDVLINGESSGITAAGFDLLRQFPPLAGQGLFRDGDNTIEFIVSNGGDGPVGLRVDAEIVEGPLDIDPPASLFSIDTGYDNDLFTTIENGQPDDHWVVLGPGIGPEFATVVPDNQFPIGPWIGTTPNSKWIGVNAVSSNGPAATISFRMKVALPEGIDASQARMIGSWTADNGASDVLINGVSTGVGVPGSFDVLSAMPADLGLGLFENGDNTIEILVVNAAPDNNPVGLRVEGVVGTGVVDPLDLSTGLGSRGVGVLPPGEVDGRYIVTPPRAAGGGPRSAVVTPAQENWIPNSGSARWVGIDGEESFGPPGRYSFHVDFTVPAHINVHRAVLTGGFATSVSGATVFLNDEPIDVSSNGPANLTAFPDGAGRGSFAPDTNRLTFVFDREGDGPAALRVEARIDVLVEANPLDISTGFDQVLGELVADGAPDDDYEVTDSVEFTEPATALGPGQAPIPPWLVNSASSRWIGPTNALGAPPGDYRYAVSVELDAGEVESAELVGFWSTDNGGIDLRINENSTGVTYDGNFTIAGYFPPGTGKGLFVEGANLIEFVVNNAGLDVNPSGLRVDAIVAVESSGPAPEKFIRGDADGSGVINITDGIFILNFLFIGGDEPPCRDAADADDSSAVNITDGIVVLNFLFLGGAQPEPPYPACGVDPTDDDGVPCGTTVTACL